MPALEHVGIAVDEVHDVLETVDTLLDVRPYKAESVSDQQIRTHFLDAATAKLELLESLDAESPVQRFLDDRGEGLHHLAFEVDDADAAMERLRDAGFTLLSDTPTRGADDKRIFFVHPKETHGVLVEFCETPKVAPWSPTPVPHRDGTLAVYERGRRNRPTVLCLHGAAGTVCHDLAPLMRRLEPQFHVVGVDLTGHGASSLPPDDELTMDRFVEDAAVTLDAVEQPSAHLFGFSMGSAVALQVAHAHPTLVDRLALFAPNVEWDDALATKLRNRLELDSLRQRAPDQADRLAARHDRPDHLLSALRAFVRTLPATSDAMRETLTAIEHPTLVAGLDRDPLFPPEAPRLVHERLPNARLAILPGSRHSLNEAPLPLLASLLRRHFPAEKRPH